VVTGFGEENPTEAPYGKPCDLWSMGVLLYVMLSKTMPFRAKQVYICVFIYLSICICIDMYRYIYIHTYVYIYIYGPWACSST